jgi:hypothetical protein
MDEFGVLHIGKTGGTAINGVLRQSRKRNRGAQVGIYPHSVTFQKVIDEEMTDKVIFFVREPVRRFVSAFNSRLRQGFPRHGNPWDAEEEKAFGFFKTPNELAEALSSPDGSVRDNALAAMDGIKHVKWNYEYFLGSIDLLNTHCEKIFFIGTTENLDEDFLLMRRLLRIPRKIGLPTDERKAHKTPDGFDTSISGLGDANLKKHYAIDYEIYNWCLDRREKLLPIRKDQAKAMKRLSSES